MSSSDAARVTSPAVTVGEVFRAWAPLWLSWGAMAIEQPAIASVVARLPDPALQLGAYGGVVFPIALVIEAPIIMLLAASTELSRDGASYRALRAFTHRAGAALTLLHVALVATPLYGWLVRGVFGVPEPVAEAARLGMVVMIPWTWSIASRRFGQGILIRFGRSRLVGVGTLFRLAVTGAALAAGLLTGWGSGVMVATSSLIAGVLAEALFVAVAVRPVVRASLTADAAGEVPLRGRAFWRFYVPLALTPLIALIIQPIGTAAISRMPQVVESLAVWPVVVGFMFFLQSPGMALAEVVVAMLPRPGGAAALRRFVALLTAVTFAVPLLLALTELAELWFRVVNGLPGELVAMAAVGFWIGLPVPACRVIQSWHQGQLVVARATRGVTEAVVVFAVVCAVVLGVGIATGAAFGVYVALTGHSLGRVAQTLWIARAARKLDRR